jgi:hypothetical protein
MELKWYLVTGDDVGMDVKPMLCEPARAEQLATLLAKYGNELHECEPQAGGLVTQIKAYAYGHYDCGGWDVIVECWSDERIADSLNVWGPKDTQPHRAASLEGALTKSTLATCVAIWAERQADAAVEGCTGDKFCGYHEFHDNEPSNQNV